MPAPRKALELFLGLGVSGALISTALQPLAPSQAQTHLQHGHSHGTSIDNDVDLLVVLAQMQGHLLVAQELITQRQFSAAEPHVGHPVLRAAVW